MSKFIWKKSLDISLFIISFLLEYNIRREKYTNYKQSLKNQSDFIIFYTETNVGLL